MAFSKAFTKECLKAWKNESPAKYEKTWVKLHKGAPTDNGTAEAAGETTRKEATWGAITEGDPSFIELSNTPEWTNVSTAETYKAISVWSAATEGTCLGAGTLETEKTVAVGDNFKLTGCKVSSE
jgi:hypothetical protein